MEWYLWVALVVAGFICGFVNVLAGSGSLITLPLLMFIGLPANVANGTNRIVILLQSVVGVGSFKKFKQLNLKQGLWLIIPAVIGSVIGAQLAVDIDEAMMRKVIGGLLVGMLLLIVFKPEAWVKGQAGIQHAKPNFIQVVIFAIIGLYGGFIQAGVGFFLLAALVLGSGFDLIKANALKLLVVLLYTPFALVVFILNDQVDYVVGLVMSVGSMAGAYVATRVAIKHGAVFVRYFLIIVLVVSSLELIGVFDYFIRLFKN